MGLRPLLPLDRLPYPVVACPAERRHVPRIIDWAAPGARPRFMNIDSQA